MFTGSVQSYPQHNYQQNQPEMSPKTDLMSMAIKNKIHSRPHVFVTKTTIRPETCGPCNRRIKFGKVALRCQDCRTSCHNECKDKVPLPCVPLGNTPNKKGGMGVIGDYAPTMSPMIPSILVHCIQEVELRGLKEVGIYRISTSDREVKALKEKFLRGKGVPNLSSLDIHTICGTIKDFLRFLREPLVTYLLWPDFVRASEMASQEDGRAAIYQAIAELPQPNRDTLAFVILHLQRVMESPEVKMPIDNIAKVFGPTLVGYSSNDPEPITILNETKKQTVERFILFFLLLKVMQFLLRIPEDYWMRFTNSGGINQAASELRHTPSSITLTRNGSNTSTYRGIFNTPLGSSSTKEATGLLYLDDTGVEKPVAAHAETHSRDFNNCYTTKVVKSLNKAICNPSQLRIWELNLNLR
uniref:Rac GTPase-activating protein 1 n=2 Tax=Timema TaxID=61471 RepID=A0A7R9B293_TIMSH|nr:unnamed protein product [Timema shepardi]